MNRSHDYDKILTRLTTILHRLYSGESLSVSELSEEFNVSTKTIQRDFNERLARFPIQKEGRRWRMASGFSIQKVQDVENTLTLQILETLAGGVGKGFEARSKALLGKLKNATPPAVESYLPIEDITSHGTLFETVEHAIAHHRILTFVYHDKPRTVHPYRIVNFDGYWYLLAHEPDSGLVKKFYFKEIHRARALDTAFTPDEALQKRTAGALNAWFDPNSEPFEVTLLAKAPIVKYLKRRPLSPFQQIMAHHPNGDIEVSIRATSAKEVAELVKGWIPDLLILSPSFAKEAFEKMLETTLARQTGHDVV
jgi:predicted DNA-binding transcriptional regulator YafY